jgi:hypothetical protein
MIHPGIEGDGATAALAPVLEAVPHYPNYGTSQDLASHFEQLAERSYPGVTVDTEQVGQQELVKGLAVPLLKSVVDLGDGDYTVYLKRGVHSNELAGGPTSQYVSELACRNPDLFRRLGVGRLVFLDADPATSDLNTWHFDEHSIYSYLTNARRSTAQADWDYPVEYNGHTHISSVPGCIASQEIIQDEHPDLIAPLHNAPVGSYYSYLMNASPGWAARMAAFMKGLYRGFPPLSPDFPESKQMAEGVYEAPSWEEAYASLAGDTDPENPEESIFGASSFHYADWLAGRQGRRAPGGVVVEAAYFLLEALADHSLSGIKKRQLHVGTHKRALDNLALVNKFLPTMEVKPGTLEAHLYKDIKVYADIYTNILTAGLAEGIKDPDRELTVSEVADMVARKNFYPVFPLGMLANLAKTVKSPHTPQITAHLRQETDYLTKVLKPRAEAPRKLVQTQVGALLLGCIDLTKQKAA